MNYLECGLPKYLQESIDEWLEWKDNPLRWDLYYNELQGSINCAEVDNEISSEQAWYLREKYLGLSKELNGGSKV